MQLDAGPNPGIVTVVHQEIAAQQQLGIQRSAGAAPAVFVLPSPAEPADCILAYGPSQEGISSMHHLVESQYQLADIQLCFILQSRH